MELAMANGFTEMSERETMSTNGGISEIVIGLLVLAGACLVTGVGGYIWGKEKGKDKAELEIKKQNMTPTPVPTPAPTPVPTPTPIPALSY